MAPDHLVGLLFPGLYVLLYLVGLVLAMAYRRRCPAACSLLMVASVLNLAGPLFRLIAPLLLPRPAEVAGIDPPIFSLLNWLAYGLILVAVFAGRNELARPRALPPDDDWNPPPAKPAADPTGIQERKP